MARLRERAEARSLALREQLRKEAGGFLDTAELAERMGVTRQAIDRRRREGGLLAQDTRRGYQFPACQLTPDGPAPQASKRC